MSLCLFGYAVPELQEELGDFVSVRRRRARSEYGGDVYSADRIAVFVFVVFGRFGIHGTDAINSQLDKMIGLIKNVDPEGVITANKTGELDTVENDAAIIYDTAKGIDLVVCFMSQDLTDTGAAQSTIAADARAIYGYYNE